MSKTETSYLANVLRLLPVAAGALTLVVLGDRVSAMWNAGNYECRQRFVRKEGLPGYTELCAIMQPHEAYRALPSAIAQEVLKKLCEAWKSYRALRAAWKKNPKAQKPGLPRYRKHCDGTRPTDWIPLKSGRAYAVTPKQIDIVLPKDLRPKGPEPRLAIEHRGRLRHAGALGRAEISYDVSRGRWYLRYAVAVALRDPRTWVKAAGIDLGVRVVGSLSIEGSPIAIHYSGRELLRDWDWHGRAIAKAQQEVAHRAVKGPDGHLRAISTAHIRQLHTSRRDRFVHAWEAIAADMVRHLLRARVGVVYLGYPKGIRRDRTYGGPWSGRIHNFWSFDFALSILEKHLRRARIVAQRTGERGTSSHCPDCRSADVVRRPRHLLSCRACGLALHSDQAGSRNMILQHRPEARFQPPSNDNETEKTPGNSRDGVEATPRTATHRWDRHQWVPRFANRAVNIALPSAA